MFTMEHSIPYWISQVFSQGNFEDKMICIWEDNNFELSEKHPY